MFETSDIENSVQSSPFLHEQLSLPIEETADFFVPNYDRNTKISAQALATFNDSYLLKNETPQDLYWRVAKTYGSNHAHSVRLYEYMSLNYFSPATPILSNGGTSRGLPISCYLNSVEDSLKDIDATWHENTWLGAKGGGIGTDWSNVREIGSKINQNGKTSGIIPFIKAMDSMMGCISQGSLRRASAAAYLNIHHPEIEEFIDIRKPTGGDPRRKVHDLHNAVVITDVFMEAVKSGEDYELLSPANGEVVSKISARTMWARLMMLRMTTGEPYLLFQDTVHRATPQAHKTLNLYANSSNLCSEIVLPTGIDYLGHDRTAVCCLSSLNLETWAEWKNNKKIIPDVMEMLDNILQDYIDHAPSEYMAKAIYAASMERSVGLGVMGFHSLLQSMNIAFESASAKSMNMQIFKHIKKQVDQASIDLADKRGPCPDAKAAGVNERFIYKMAIAPTASISVLSMSTSPSVEPWLANTFTHKTKSGSFVVRNRHLEAALEKHGKNTEETWLSITQNKGSVQHLNFLTEQQKYVFKTAIELDQAWIIDLASDRAPYIDQAQSINLFFAPTEKIPTVSKLHFAAWQKGLKSLYYCRSLSAQRAENSSATIVTTEPVKTDFELPNSDECLACQ